MKYRAQCLTPVLVGDGSTLAPIDYMVWKNQINVLDQRRIFRILAKGPRLEGYLTQIKKADKLDFASWGGFAQNYALRRIAFEHPIYAQFWEKMHPADCHIPLFASAAGGPYLPGSALRGALRTALVAQRASVKTLAAQASAERRRPAEAIEHQAVGGASHDLMKALAIADSRPVSNESFRVFLVRTAVLMEQKGKREYTLGWKHANGSSLEARRVLDSTPRLAEMAMPGTVFEGDWIERAFYQSKEVAQQMHWRETIGFRQLAKAANDLAAVQLAAHKRFAEAAQLPYLLATLGELEQRLAAARERNACLVSIGRGGGYLTKTAFPDTADAAVRQALGEVTPYGRALRTGMPFPKTRRIVFLENHPVALPGWVWLEVS